MAEKKKVYLNAINKYNNKTYDKISFRVQKDLAKAFKEKCLTEGVSQAQIFKEAIEKFLQND